MTTLRRTVPSLFTAGAVVIACGGGRGNPNVDDPRGSNPSTPIDCAAGACACSSGGCVGQCADSAQRCAMDCAKGQCKLTCPSSNPCNLDCSSGKCLTYCGANKCDVECSGGNCNTSCPPGGACSVNCSGGGCVLSCASSANCLMGCSGGNCKLQCAGNNPMCQILGCGSGCKCEGAGCQK